VETNPFLSVRTHDRKTTLKKTHLSHILETRFANSGGLTTRDIFDKGY
jgi:hypothetical protein